MAALDQQGRSLGLSADGGISGEDVLEGRGEVALIIGGSPGLAPEVFQRAGRGLSFSKMAFPLSDDEVTLLEQIYRGIRIMRHELYHR